MGITLKEYAETLLRAAQSYESEATMIEGDDDDGQQGERIADLRRLAAECRVWAQVNPTVRI